MNAKTNHSVKQHKTTKDKGVSPEYIVHQLNEDVRDSVLVVSLLVNLFVLIGWLVIQVSTRYDAALINYLQHK